MKQSTIKWHLARDNQVALCKFCIKNCIKQSKYGDNYKIDNKEYFQMMFQFDNNSFIRVELQAGDTKSYTIADCFQVVDYSLGSK